MFKMKYGTWKNLTSSHWEDVENNWKLLEISFVIVCNLNIYFSQNFMFLAGCRQLMTAVPPHLSLRTGVEGGGWESEDSQGYIAKPFLIF